jgi:hypothetical protein
VGDRGDSGPGVAGGGACGGLARWMPIAVVHGQRRRVAAHPAAAPLPAPREARVVGPLRHGHRGCGMGRPFCEQDYGSKLIRRRTERSFSSLWPPVDRDTPWSPSESCPCPPPRRGLSCCKRQSVASSHGRHPPSLHLRMYVARSRLNCTIKSTSAVVPPPAQPQGKDRAHMLEGGHKGREVRGVEPGGKLDEPTALLKVEPQAVRCAHGDTRAQR